MILKKIIFPSLLVTSFFVQYKVFGAIPVSVPEPDVWFDELLASNQTTTLRPFTYVVVEEIEKRYELVNLELNPTAIFANPVQLDQVKFSKDVNLKMPSGGCTASPESFGFCVGAQYVLSVSSSKWQLYAMDTEGKAQLVFSGKREPKQSYSEWIQEKLGFDGVVLAIKNGFLLAQVPETSTPGETQVLAIKDSVDQLYLGAGKRQGAGLLSVAKRKGKLATLSAIIVEGGTSSGWRSGMKIAIEKSKKGK